MNSVILSIKPKFIEMMASGQKNFEFRKNIFKNKNINKVYIYASSPISKIVGKFEIESIIFDTLSRVWEDTKDNSGINYDEYMNYFSNKQIAYAIKVKNLILFDTKDYKSIFDFCGRKTPPQNFYYFNESLEDLKNESRQCSFDF